VFVGPGDEGIEWAVKWVLKWTLRILSLHIIGELIDVERSVALGWAPVVPFIALLLVCFCFVD
jgi:hypothetical protein